MKTILIRIMAVFGGLMAGGILNMSIITLSDKFISPPPGADLTTLEGIKAAMPLMQPIHFLMPFLAHALGSFFGAFVGTKINPPLAFQTSMIIAIAFMAGGIANCVMLPAPMWFEVTDTLLAYLPSAYAGYYLSKK